MFTIDTFVGRDRMSTEDLLLKIGAAVKSGETDFFINGSGQHDIGGPLWNAEGKTLHFTVINAGQRLGSMCLPNTEIVAEGSVSADAGWLNSGGLITVKGDAGDTAGHCASGGKIYIGGRAGTRTGSLMKHDPLYDPPELWVLGGTGSFSFEFMGGGIAVVCGIGAEDEESVLGARPCVGMVGGTVYVRGSVAGYPADIKCVDLDAADIEFLTDGLDKFLAAVERSRYKERVTKWDEWHKLVPLTFAEKKPKQQSDIKSFHRESWFAQGMFSDVATDDGAVLNTVNTGLYRLRVPRWDNAVYAAPCEFSCPCGIPTQQRYKLLREEKYAEAAKLVLNYTPFPACVCGTLCPNPCMDGCTRGKIDEPIQIGALGRISAETEAPTPAPETGKKVAVIGGGAAGLSTAWQLRLKGHDVTVYDDGATLGGKLEQAIPRFRLPHELLEKELQRIENIGIKFVPNTRVDKAQFAAIKSANDAVVVAVGGSKSRYFPWEGIENLTMGLDYLKAINRGGKPAMGRRVVVIGAGNAGMDVARTAYAQGAKEVIAVDVQTPAAFPEEIARFEAEGGKIIYPFITKKIAPDGLTAADGTFIPCDQAIVAIGEEPVIDFLPSDAGIKTFRNSWLVTDDKKQIMAGVFAAGDVIKPGRLTDAIGDGIAAAKACDEYLCGENNSDSAHRNHEAISPLDTPLSPLARQQTPLKGGCGESGGAIASNMVPRQKIPAERLATAYFSKCHHCALPTAEGDTARCVSCGTCRDCQMCLESCPEKAITRTALEGGGWEYSSDAKKCIGCGICAAVCPCGIWTLLDNPEPIKMYRTYEKNSTKAV